MRQLAFIVLACAVYATMIMHVPELPRGPAVSAREVLDTARTGDILLFRSKTAGKSLLLVNPYTHIATVVRNSSGEAYAVEIHAAGDGPTGKEPEGVHAYPLLERVRYNGVKTDLFLVRLNHTCAPAVSDALLDSLPLDMRYNTDYIKDEVKCHFAFTSPDITARMHCANFASYMLQALGIANAEQCIQCTRPIDVVSSLKLRPPFEYDHVSPVVGSSR